MTCTCRGARAPPPTANTTQPCQQSASTLHAPTCRQLHRPWRAEPISDLPWPFVNHSNVLLLLLKLVSAYQQQHEQLPGGLNRVVQHLPGLVPGAGPFDRAAPAPDRLVHMSRPPGGTLLSDPANNSDHFVQWSRRR